jgi:hypothetical protein
MGIRPIHIKAIPEKSSADIELSLSLQEIMLTRSDIDTMVVIAGDRDYMPVTHRVREKARHIIFFSFKECLSGDLKKLVGNKGYYFLDSSTGKIIEKIVPRPSVEKKEISTLVENHVKISSALPLIEGDDKKIIVEEQKQSLIHEGLTESQSKALNAAIIAELALNPPFNSVKVGKFLVVDLASVLPEFDHLKRKEIFNSLVDAGLIKVEQEVSNWGNYYATFKLNRESSIVRDSLKEHQE